MTPFELSVFMFFAAVVVASYFEMSQFCREYSELESMMEAQQKAVTPNPKHIAPPIRKSPTNPNFRTEPRPMVGAHKRPAHAKTTRVSHPVHANRNVRPARYNNPAVKPSIKPVAQKSRTVA